MGIFWIGTNVLSGIARHHWIVNRDDQPRSANDYIYSRGAPPVQARLANIRNRRIRVTAAPAQRGRFTAPPADAPGR